MTCPHTFTERELAVTCDGMCAQCSSAESAELRTKLNDLVDAWEKLAGGQRYKWYVIEEWLKKEMAPAINEARRVLGREK